jgi:hypothetical protein
LDVSGPEKLAVLTRLLGDQADEGDAFAAPVGDGGGLGIVEDPELFENTE